MNFNLIQIFNLFCLGMKKRYYLATKYVLFLFIQRADVSFGYSDDSPCSE